MGLVILGVSKFRVCGPRGNEIMLHFSSNILSETLRNNSLWSYSCVIGWNTSHYLYSWNEVKVHIMTVAQSITPNVRIASHTDTVTLTSKCVWVCERQREIQGLDPSVRPLINYVIMEVLKPLYTPVTPKHTDTCSYLCCRLTSSSSTDTHAHTPPSQILSDTLSLSVSLLSTHQDRLCCLFCLRDTHLSVVRRLLRYSLWLLSHFHSLFAALTTCLVIVHSFIYWFFYQ